MVVKKRPEASKTRKTLKLKRETIKDLGPRGTVKGGAMRTKIQGTPLCPTRP